MKYEEEALATLSNKCNFNPNYTSNTVYQDTTSGMVTVDILHGAIGIVTEAGEIMDAAKKSIFYGKHLDIVNLQEEIGDCFWYLAILAKEAGMSFEDIMTQNLAKLKARYPDKFTEEKALNRDLIAERRELEGNSGVLGVEC